MVKKPEGLPAFFGDQKGSTALMFGLSTCLLFGAVAFAVDYGVWTAKKTSLRNAASAASIVGARELAEAVLDGKQDDAPALVLAAAQSYLSSNGADQSHYTISASTSRPYKVVVKLSEVGKQYVSQVVKPNGPIIRSQSTAIAVAAEDACVVALDQSASPGIDFGLSGSVIADGCSIWSNSETDSSLKGSGSGTITSSANCAVGGSVVGGGLNLSPPARSHCFPVRDPLASWNPPSYPGGCTANKLVLDKPGNYTLAPGVYCGGISIKGGANVTLAPGMFVIEGGQFLIEGGGSVRGNDVSILLTKGASVDFGGASFVDLAASSYGPMAGMIIAAGRDEPLTTSVFRGSAVFRLEGHVYLPKQHVRYSGGPVGTSPASYATVIAKTLKFEGSSQIKFRNNSGGTSFSPKAFTHVYISE